MLIFYAGGLQIRQNNTTQQTERCHSADRTMQQIRQNNTAHPTEHRSDRPFDKKSCLMLASLQKKSYL